MKNTFLLDEKFRPGSMYHLVEWNQMSQDVQNTLITLYDDVNVYGVFLPVLNLPGLIPKVAYREIALLYLHLQHSACLPRYLIASGDRKINQIIAQLVLDNILEIEFNGDFVSGPASVKTLFGETFFEKDVIPDKLSHLSMDGIRYAWMLRNHEAKKLAGKLYSFNTTPWDARSKLEFNNARTVNEFLFPSSELSLNDLLDKKWKVIYAENETGWFAWNRPVNILPNLQRENASIFKLYVSPVIEDLPKVIKIVVPILSISDSYAFKVGSELTELLRPDKMVAYFDDKNALMETCRTLEPALRGCGAHGVPFTGQIDQSGLLSWGIDPPESDTLELIEGGSWRTHVTDKLAIAIIRAKEEQLKFEQAMAFIQAKLFTDGIKTKDWTPTNSSN
jgi:hypothetical protein